jgi:thiamine monophosphate synthase
MQTSSRAAHTNETEQDLSRSDGRAKALAEAHAYSPEPARPGALLVTDRRATGGRDLWRPPAVVRALDAGLPAVQPATRTRRDERLRAGRTPARRHPPHGCPALVNDRVDVARAVDADGVQPGA